MGILALQERQRTRLFVRRDRYGRFFSVLVFLPRDRFDATCASASRRCCKRAFNGERLDSTIQVSRIGARARCTRSCARRPASARSTTSTELEAEARRRSCATGTTSCATSSCSSHGEEKGLKLANRYGKALPAGYIEEVTP